MNNIFNPFTNRKGQALLLSCIVLFSILFPFRTWDSYISSTMENKFPVDIPFLHHAQDHAFFTIEGKFTWYNPFDNKLKIVADDCLKSLKINHVDIDLSNYPQNYLCDYRSGITLNLDTVDLLLVNTFQASISDKYGKHGLAMHSSSASVEKIFVKILWLIYLTFIIMQVYKYYSNRSILTIKNCLWLIKKLFIHNKWITWIPISIFTLFMINLFWDRLLYELKGPFTWDTTIYWAVGRGMLNGQVPWQEMFETKPIGIFLLSAISQWISGGNYLTNVFQVVVLTLPILGLSLIVYSLQKEKIRFNYTELLIILCITIAHMYYVAIRSGEVQVESFGACFAILYILTLQYYNALNKKTFYCLSSAFIMLSIGFKEPFIIPIIVGAVIFSKDKLEFLKKFVIPSSLASIIGMLILLTFGSLTAYFKHYLGFIFGSHIGHHGSVWDRMLRIDKFEKDLSGVSNGYLMIIIFLFTFFVIHQLIINRHTNNIEKSLEYLLKNIILILATGFIVGLGGQFYNHHYIFATPIYFILFIYFLKEINTIPIFFRSWSWTILLISIGFMFHHTHVYDYEDNILSIKANEAREKMAATYVDTILHLTDNKNYLFFGANGPQVYAYTKHSPLGPNFFQYKNWLKDPKVYSRIIENLNKVDIIVVNNYKDLGPIKGFVKEHVEMYFSLDPWEPVKHIQRQDTKYKIYFRKPLSSVTQQTAPRLL